MSDHPDRQPDSPPHQPSGTDKPATDQPHAADHLSDTEFAQVLLRGPIAPLSVWRRAYHRIGIPWPGQAEIRRRHRVTDTDTTDTAQATTVWQMSWPVSDQHPPNDDTDHHQPRRCDDQPDTARRLTEAFGWEHPPTLTAEQQRQTRTRPRPSARTPLLRPGNRRTTGTPHRAPQHGNPRPAAGSAPGHGGNPRPAAGNTADASVDCVVTSPPYFALRDYGTGRWIRGRRDCPHTAAPSTAAALRTGTPRTCPHCGAVWIDHQHGLEPTLADYIDRMVAVFRQARRVLRPTGTLWLNIGDCYASTETGRNDAERRYPSFIHGQPPRGARRTGTRTGIPPKNLLGVPWRLALALQSDGWWLRNAIVWAKKTRCPSR